MDKLEVEAAKKKKGEIPEPVMREYLEKYEEIRQVRVPVEKDSQGNDVTPSREAFMKKGSKRVPAPSAEEGAGKDIQCTALISDLILTAEELGSIKKCTGQ